MTEKSHKHYDVIMQRPMQQLREAFIAACAKGPIDSEQLDNFLTQLQQCALDHFPAISKELKTEIKHINAALKNGTITIVPNLNHPLLQLAWASTVAFEISQHNGATGAIYKCLTTHPLLENYRRLFALQIKAMLPQPNDVRMGWVVSNGLRVSHYCSLEDENAKGRFIGMDLMYTLAMGLATDRMRSVDEESHAASDIMHEVAHALGTRFSTSVQKIRDEIAQIKEEGKKAGKYTKEQYIKLHQLETQWAIRHQVFDAAENNYANKFSASQTNFKNPYDYAINCTQSIYDYIRSIGDSHPPTPQQLFNNVRLAIDNAFFTTNELFEDTEEEWRAHHVQPDWITCPDPENPDTRISGMPALKLLMESCHKLEELVPTAQDTWLSDRGYREKVQEYSDARNAIIDDIFDRFIAHLMPEIDQQVAEQTQEQMQQAANQSGQGQEENDQSNENEQDSPDNAQDDGKSCNSDNSSCDSGSPSENESPDESDGKKSKGKGKSKAGSKPSTDKDDEEAGKDNTSNDAAEDKDEKKEESKTKGKGKAAKDQENGEDKPEEGQSQGAGKKEDSSGEQEKDGDSGDKAGEDDKDNEKETGKAPGDSAKETPQVPVEGVGDMPDVELPPSSPSDKPRPQELDEDTKTIEELIEELMMASHAQTQPQPSASSKKAPTAIKSPDMPIPDEPIRPADWNEYMDIVSANPHAIALMIKLGQDIQKRQIIVNESRTRTHDHMPDDHDFTRFDLEKHQSFITKVLTNQPTSEGDSKRYLEDAKIDKKQAPVDIYIILDISDSMRGAPYNTAVAAATVMFEGFRSKTKGRMSLINVHISTLGGEINPQFIAKPGDSHHDIGKRIAGARRKIGGNTHFLPALKLVLNKETNQPFNKQQPMGQSYIFVVTDCGFTDPQYCLPAMQYISEHSEHINMDYLMMPVGSYYEQQMQEAFIATVEQVNALPHVKNKIGVTPVAQIEDIPNALMHMCKQRVLGKDRLAKPYGEIQKELKKLQGRF